MARFADRGENTGVNTTESVFENGKPYEKATQGASIDWKFRHSDCLSLIFASCTTISCSDCIFEQVAEEVLDVSQTLPTVKNKLIM